MNPTYREGQKFIWQYGTLPHEKMVVVFKSWCAEGYADVRGTEKEYAGGKFTARAEELTPCRNLPAWF